MRFCKRNVIWGFIKINFENQSLFLENYFGSSLLRYLHQVRFSSILKTSASSYWVYGSLDINILTTFFYVKLTSKSTIIQLLSYMSVLATQKTINNNKQHTHLKTMINFRSNFNGWCFYFNILIISISIVAITCPIAVW